MKQAISQALGDYESGRITRRQLVAHVGSLALLGMAGGNVAAQDAPSTFQGVGLNHIALRVTDVKRSRDFYVKHLGLSVHRESDSACFLNCGDNFVALFRSEEAGMHHYCYSVEGYDVGKAEKTLKGAGFDPDVQENRIYFPDPDGLTVQLSSPAHGP